VEAILQATVQVLLKEGKERLTTTRVAERAGVSVGTLYQYFPNKSSLLQAVLQLHMDQLADAVERACREQHGRPLAEMVAALIDAFLAAKMRKAKTSAALYAISSDLDGARIVQRTGARVNKAVVAMLASSPEPLAKPPELLAAMLQGALGGVSRQLIESPAPEKLFPELREELIFLAQAYLAASVAEAAVA
jgi:AcrR family transcriptional regulator